MKGSPLSFSLLFMINSGLKKEICAIFEGKKLCLLVLEYSFFITLIAFMIDLGMKMEMFAQLLKGHCCL